VTAAEADPYVLPAPAPASPVVLPERISPGNTHPVSRYQDLTWSLAPLIDNPGVRLWRIRWKDCPGQLRGPLRQAAWAMINGELRPTYLRTRGHSARARSSATTVSDTCREWMRLARWLDARGITSLAACTAAEWRDYAAGRVSDGVSREHARKTLGQLTDLWAFDQLTAHPSGITRPPWETEGADGYLPAAEGAASGENTTEPLDPKVIGPLLVWAIRVTEDFSDDILAAWAENRRMTALAGSTAGSAAGRAALEAYLLPLARSGSPFLRSGTGARSRWPATTSPPPPEPAPRSSTASWPGTASPPWPPGSRGPARSSSRSPGRSTGDPGASTWTSARPPSSCGTWAPPPRSSAST
jgi:hypothetical protein